jgi:hypothetical protein
VEETSKKKLPDIFGFQNISGIFAPLKTTAARLGYHNFPAALIFFKMKEH